MENLQSKSTIIHHRGNELSLQELSQSYKRISEVEKKIVQAREAGLAISQLEIAELTEILGDVLINISVITGHKTPTNELYLELLIEELKVYLYEYGFDNLTIQEIILAFRLNCKCNFRYLSGDYAEPISIFGEYISVDYVSRVLHTYLTFRNILDSNLKNIVDGY